VLSVLAPGLLSAQEQKPAQSKPNILVIMGDDIGWFNPSIYHRGIMGYETPNIDRIGKEGAMFTDWYGQQSCTAGVRRSSPDSLRSARGSRRLACPLRTSVCAGPSSDAERLVD
jgi:Sulfatase